MPSPQVNLSRWGQTVAGVTVAGNTEISPATSGTTIQVDAAPTGTGVLVNGSGTALSQVTDATQPVVRLYDTVETFDLTMSGHAGVIRTLGAHDILIQTSNTTRIDVSAAGTVTFPTGIGGPLTISGGLTISSGGLSVTGTSALGALTATTGTFTGLLQAQLGLTVTGGTTSTQALSSTTINASGLITGTAGATISGGTTTTGAISAGAITATTGTFSGLVQANLGLNVAGAAFTSRGITDNATSTAISIASTGAVTHNAPSSGTALTVSGVSGSGVLTTINPADTPTSNNVLFAGPTKAIRIGTASTFAYVYGVDQTGTGSFQPLNVAGATVSLGIGTSPYLSIGANGNVTVNAPTSGTALTVNGLNTSVPDLLVASAGSGSSPSLQVAGTFAGVITATIQNLSTNAAGIAGLDVQVSNNTLILEQLGSGATGVSNQALGGPSGQQAIISTSGTNQPLTFGANGNAGLVINKAMTLGNALDISGRGVALCRFKAADTSRTSTTVVASDPDLTLAISAAGTYIFEFVLGLATPGLAGATPGFSFQVNYSGTFNPTQWAAYGVTDAATTISNALNTTANTHLWSSNTAFQGGIINVRGVLKATGAGTLVLQWAQQTSSANATTLSTGSYMTVTQVS